MRYLWFFAFVTVILGCNEVVPGTCRPNTTGGAGGADSLAVGAGVGVSATTGTYGADPPKEAQDANGGDPNGGDSNPCETPDNDASEAGTYIRCWGLGPMACSAKCFAIGAYCVEYAAHPENPSIGIGALKQCMENTLSFTCTYCYSNGDVCTYIRARFGSGVGRCTNTGGKGCE